MKKITLLLLFLLKFGTSFSQYNFQQFIAYPGYNFGDPLFFTIFNNNLYYQCTGSGGIGSELWKSNGTQNGTSLFADINTIYYNSSSNPADFFEFNGYLYFTASTVTNGRELYRTNGTTTELFKEFRNGSDSGFDSYLNEYKFIIINNEMYFFAREDEFGYDLWKTDGTILGTQKLVELNSFGLGLKDYFFELNGDLIFLMDDTNDTVIGRELYKYSVTTNTVSLVKDINPANANTSTIHTLFLTKFDGKLFLNAFDGVSSKLYVTDGTEAGTSIIQNATPINYSQPAQLYVFNNELYFIATVNGVGIDLYKCNKDIDDEDEDGDEDDYIIKLVYDFNAGGNNNLIPFVNYQLTNVPSVFLEHNNELYFAAREQNAPNNGNNYQIYKTNGTTTQIAFTIDETQMGTANDPLYLLKSFDNRLFFTIKGLGMPANQLWVTNTANASVTRLTDFYGTNNQPQNVAGSIENPPIIFNNEMYFRASTANEGIELWKISNSNLSTENFENNAKISIYPNPTSNILNINIKNSNNFEVTVFDLMGKKVALFKNQKSVDISNLNNGMYLIKVTDLENNTSQSLKIIKQ